MKKIIEYNFPEDHYEYTLAERGSSFYNVIIELDSYLRNICKHGDLEVVEYDIHYKIREKLIELREINEAYDV